MHRKLFVETYGCQMNFRDSEEVIGKLLEQGYELSNVEDDSDVILYNTCSVREHAENRVWSNVGRLKKLKAQRPEVVIGIMGCMAKAHREDVLKRLPHVDFISGPAQLYQVPELVESIFEERQPMVAIKEKQRPEFQNVSYHAGKVTALVTIMEGCDKVCSYCIIPYTRGPEISRPPAQILEEVQDLVARGYKEVMLLGQNVNSYGRKLDEATDFPELLRQVNAIEGIERIRFITSHPWDAVEDMYEAMRDCEHVCEQLHLPVQSGSDTVLERMRRGYTSAEYLEKVRLLREMMPDSGLSTDIIVGFPGETDADFEATLEVVRQAQFDSAFMFKYSPRPFAASSRWEDDVPREVKDERLQRLIALQEEMSRQRDQRLLEKTVEVLVEEPGKGRTRCNRKAYFEEPAEPGTLVHLNVASIRGHSVVGTLA